MPACFPRISFRQQQINCLGTRMVYGKITGPTAGDPFFARMKTLVTFIGNMGIGITLLIHALDYAERQPDGIVFHPFLKILEVGP